VDADKEIEYRHARSSACGGQTGQAALLRQAAPLGEAAANDHAIAETLTL